MEDLDECQKQQLFEGAVAIVNEAMRRKEIAVSNEERLTLYALYKIVTVGQHPAPPRPAFGARRAMWDAWENASPTPKAQARERYVARVANLTPN